MPSAEDPPSQSADGTYTTFDGQALHYRAWPAATEAHAPLVYLHGIESHGGWFGRTARLLADGGVSVYAPDRRGSGRNRTARGHCRAYEHLLVDLLIFLQDVVPATRVHLLGLSWGAKLAFAFAREYPERCASLVLVSPGVWPRVDLAPALKLSVATRWLLNAARPIPVPLSPELFSDRPTVRHEIETDRDRLTQVTPSFLWESRRLDRRIRQAKDCPVPICAVLSRPDRIVDTPRTEAWLAQLTAPQRRTTILDAGHALQLECPGALADRLLQWIAELPA